MRHPAVRIFRGCSGVCLLEFHAMSSGTIEGPQLNANKASVRGPERRPIEHFPYGSGALSPTSAQQALRPPNSEASRPPITSPRDQLDLNIGVCPMRSPIRLERSTMKSSRSTRSLHRGLSDAGVDPSSVTRDPVRSRRPYLRGLSDPITDLGRSFILASQTSYQALPWLGGPYASPKQGNFTFLHLLVGVGDTLLLFSPWGGVTERTQRMIATHAVGTCERMPLIELLELIRCTSNCDVTLILLRSQKPSSITCSQKGFPFGVGHRPHVGWVVLPISPVHFDVLARTTQEHQRI